MTLDAGNPHNSTAQIPAPPPLTSRWIRFVLGFGISVAIGLAPYLGKINVPLFSPLLNLIPESLQDTILPLSSASMGVIAVVVQWYGAERLTDSWLRRMFKNTLFLVVGFFFILVIVHKRVVAIVPYSGGTQFKSFTIGFSRPDNPPCTNLAPSACISDHLTFNPIRIETYFGSNQIFYGEITLELSYLLFMSSFSVLVGVLVLKQQSIKTLPKESDVIRKVIRRNIKRKEVKHAFCGGDAIVTYSPPTIISPVTTSPESLSVYFKKIGKYQTVISAPGFDSSSGKPKVYFSQTISNTTDLPHHRLDIETKGLPIDFEIHIMKDSSEYWESAIVTRIPQPRETAELKVRERIRHYGATQLWLRGEELESFVDRSMDFIRGE